MLLQVVLAILLGAVLLVSAGLKLADRTGTAIAAATYGLTGRPARWIWLPLAALETLLAAGLLAGSSAAAWTAAAMLAAFAGAQATAVAAGRGGAPCGCFGARGQISWASAARAAALSGPAVLLALAPAAASVTVHAAGAAAALVLAAVLVVRARRASVPDGALEIAGEGPPLGAALPLGLDRRAGSIRLALFTAEGCRLCRGLEPYAERLGAVIFDEDDDAAEWARAAVPGAPFAVALSADGIVLAKGTVNTRRQIASVLAVARERAGLEPLQPDRSDAEDANSRRGFLVAAGGAAAALAVARTVGSLVQPGDADAHHFCGHIYTTDGCPHPTGLPRIDSRGLPLRARDGVPVDDLGRRINSSGEPIEEDGQPIVDTDGRPLPPATRTRVCVAAGRRFRIQVRTDGSWHRCCKGHVRKLIDCCTTSRRRINGDRALRGYCYRKRRVFCVMYYQTKVPC